MELIAKSTQKTGKQKMTRAQLIELISANANLMEEREEIIAYITSLKTGEVLNEKEIRAGYQAFKAQKAAADLANLANKNGLHARPAAEIVKAASKFKSDITIARDDLEVNGKSIMGVMMLAAEYGSELLLRADGADEEDAVTAIAKLIESKFGES